jgi:hypothetical protein
MQVHDSGQNWALNYMHWITGNLMIFLKSIVRALKSVDEFVETNATCAALRICRVQGNASREQGDDVLQIIVPSGLAS